MLNLKKIMFFCSLFLAIIAASPAVIAQENGNLTESGNAMDESPRDGFYDRDIFKNKRILAYDHINEKDVLWQKRIWRVIDVREKINHPFKYEERPLINILLDLSRKGDIRAFSTVDDKFTDQISEEEIKNIGSSIDTITTIDPETFDPITEIVFNELDPADVKKYRIKEEWYFDEERSEMGVRILGIAPIMDKYDDNGNFIAEIPMFWCYYPEVREVLAREEVFNEYNEAQRMTWEDLFEARHFSSYVYKENNVFNRRIKDYKTNLDILYEGEKIKNSMFNYENDLWEY
jgi:gliding motility associated protien GldN